MSTAFLRQLDPGRPLHRLLFYRVCWSACWLLLTLVYRLRVLHGDRVPRTGGVLVIANHQSHFDPPAVGVALRIRHIVPIARQGLFKSRVLGWVIARLNAIPVNEKEGDTVAIRKAVRELAEGRCILIFPEGARTFDGHLQTFKRGAWVLISRAKVPVLPAGIDGFYHAWPRQRHVPFFWRRRTAVAFGEPIDHDRLLAMGPEEGLAFLTRRVEELRLESARLIGPRHASPPTPLPIRAPGAPG
jgi:1-acyl-sn-glycerol-3-phosphate acyltransferase